MNFGIKTIITGYMIVGLFTQSFSQKIGLEQVIREVCANSDSVKMMKETVKKSDLLVKENWSAVYPTISASGAIARSYGSLFSSGGSSSSSSSSHSAPTEDAMAKKEAAPYDPNAPVTYGALNDMFGSISKPMTTTIYNTGLQISQTLYTFGKVGTALKVAKNLNESTLLTYKRNMQTLQLGALDAFFRTELAERAVAIVEHSLSRKKELYDFLNRNFQNGSGSKAQVLSTKADVLNQNVTLVIAKRDARTARMQLNVFMGRTLTDSMALDTIEVPQSLKAFVLPKEDDAVTNAMQDREDLKSLKFLTETNKDGAKIYRAMYLPSIGAQGSAGYSKMVPSVNSSFIPPGWQKSWTLGIGAQWTLFDGFANSSRAARYESDAHKLEITYNSFAKMIEIDVRSTTIECLAADSNYIASQEMFGSATESYDLTNSNFKQGSGQFSDLQLSDELLQQSELGLFNARYRQMRSRAALLIAMGREIISLN
jgi:HAE1 family hydrophobic/amphiphilic exporter-1